MKSDLTIRPISLAQANAFVLQHHRHHGEKKCIKFCLSVVAGGAVHGVAICSNPVARNADDGLTIEVSRLCTDGTYNACSMLYGACARVARDMGYRKIQTYILASENGTSLKASGWTLENEHCGGLNWNNNARQRERDSTKQLSLFPEKKPPEEYKQRWVKYL